MPRCARCRHREDQHIVRDGLRICVLCDVSDAGGACSKRLLENERRIAAVDA